MSDIPADWRGQLDLRAEIARIDRDHADIVKLQAEAKKYNRDAWVLALAALIAMFGTVMAAIVARLPELLAAFGWAH
jgi:hypothetical protein